MFWFLQGPLPPTRTVGPTPTFVMEDNIDARVDQRVSAEASEATEFANPRRAHARFGGLMLRAFAG